MTVLEMGEPDAAGGRVHDQFGSFALVPTFAIEALRGRGTALVVYVVLASHVDRTPRGGDTWDLSRKKIAEEAGVSESTVKRALRELQDLGLVEVEANVLEDGDRGWNTYHLLPGVGSTMNRGGVTSDPTSGHPRPRDTDKETDQRTNQSFAAKAPRARRPADEVWDVLVEGFGAPTTKTANALYGKITDSIAGALRVEGIAEEEWRAEVIRRCEVWPEHFDTATLTLTALEKHWPALGRPPYRKART